MVPVIKGHLDTASDRLKKSPGHERLEHCQRIVFDGDMVITKSIHVKMHIKDTSGSREGGRPPLTAADV